MGLDFSLVWVYNTQTMENQNYAVPITLAPDRIVSSAELQKELSTLEPQKGWETGLYHLDKMTQGFKEGDLVILSGLTGNGKTTFAITLAQQFIKQNALPLFFSYEMSSQELLEKFEQPIPTFYLPRIPKSKSAEWIESKIKEAITKHDVKIVFIDHLHYLVDEWTTRTKNTSEMLGQMCRDFKQIARKHKVVIFLLCHVRKFTTDHPQMQDVKDSSGIIQEADTVLIIHRGKKKVGEEYELDTNATLYVEKVRRMGGKLGKIDLTFDGDKQSFREL